MLGTNHEQYDGNITLIGMAGCGKSTNGVLLAKALNLAFVDTDLIIQNREGMYLSQIIETRGLEQFISIEADAICSLDCKNSCIATGGSVVYAPRAMEHLRKISKVIYLSLPFSEIDSRVKDVKSRGIVIEEGKNLSDIYHEREPLYEKYADIRIDTMGYTIEQTVERIIKKLQEER